MKRFEKYSFGDVQKEADLMAKKVTSGKAPNYSEAEILAVNDKIISENKIVIPKIKESSYLEAQALKQKIHSLWEKYSRWKKEYDKLSSVKFWADPTKTPAFINLEKSEKPLNKLLDGIMRARFIDFINQNRNLVAGVPDSLLLESLNTDKEGWDMRQLGFLLSLPYHLKKMRDDGITHLLLSATSSIPYGFILKKLDRLIYPDQEPIKFLIYSTHIKAKGKGKIWQNNKFKKYFEGKPNAIIGVFDECASSYEKSAFNKRNTVTNMQTGIERLLQVKVRGRYGTDTIYLAMRNSELLIKSSEYGDEGKGQGLFSREEYNEEQKLKSRQRNIFTSNPWDLEAKGHTNSKIPDKGYARIEKGSSGLDFVKRLRDLAEIAYTNYSSNPNSIWDPFDERIRRRRYETD